MNSSLVQFVMSAESFKRCIEMSDDIICRNRVFECLGCGFVGREQKAVEHQIKCDNPMRQVTKGVN